ncbi:ATP-binding protein [Altererythrobacter sp. KTW20L]|uniref:histidine kinase dimerization/phosphoacceptor domain -containing protein n=1 Tax=Altererythrobacter sp. KTW20L TaxID=2942210 RepID=UPI0020BF755E|nr:histidine kinase dimerization/phosphoacceptor domain -containing protein [Altererythrobacter sp. KTW20L]MCL6251495.1 ATP-binding protein [Altererythrobacter sp. KTW20L]
MKPGLHPQEDERLRELHRYGILDTDRERDFDELVELASELCGTPVSVVNFIDEGRQWFKAEVGLGVRSTPLDTSMCGHAILQGDFVEIPDTLLDRRMADNPLCNGPDGFRFYAGAVLYGENGLPLGTLCVLDRQPRRLTDSQRNVLRVLSKHVMRELNLRAALEKEQTLRREVDHRVKNSLASIGALLAMRARRADDDAVRMALEDASARIRSLASLHAELHDLAEGEAIDLQALFKRIEGDLHQLLPANVRLDLVVHGDRAASNLANGLLLVVNEFISNSVKHGFRDGSGTITIEITVDDTMWAITCQDDGSGSAEDARRAAAASGFGTRVIQSLASSLDASVNWQSQGGGMMLTVQSGRH